MNLYLEYILWNGLRWVPQNPNDHKSTLVQVMAWCRQATSHYLSQCWPRSMSPYGVTGPQWGNQHCRVSLGPGGGGYSLCDGWYICAAVLTPFFHFGRIEHDLLGVLFLIHQQQSYLLGYKNYQFLQKSIFLAANSIFSSIFLGPIFSGQRHTPISFQAEYPPPPPPRGLGKVCCWLVKRCNLFRAKNIHRAKQRNTPKTVNRTYLPKFKFLASNK